MTREDYLNTVAQILAQAKSFARQPYAWPGGYPLVLVMSDGEVLCAKCTRTEFPQIARSTIQRARDGWQCEGVQVHWEGSDEYCAHCNTAIKSAYGDPDSGEE